MSYRQVFVLVAFAAGLLAGNLLSGSGDSPAGTLVAPTPALGQSGSIMPLGKDMFVSTDGPNAYMWQWDGSRVVLLGECARVEADSRQATYTWLPGVERGS